jgi:hypothetical protein
MRASLDIRFISSSSISYLVGNWAATPRRTQAVVVIIEDIVNDNHQSITVSFFLSEIFFLSVCWGGAFRPAELRDRLTARGICGRNQFN